MGWNFQLLDTLWKEATVLGDRVVGGVLCGADWVMLARGAPHSLIIGIMLSERLLGNRQVVMCLQLAGKALAPEHVRDVPDFDVVQRVARRRYRLLKLQPILIAKFQLFLNLHPRILLDILKILLDRLPRRIAHLVIQGFLDVLVEVEVIQLLQFLIDEYLLLRIRTALGGRVDHIFKIFTLRLILQRLVEGEGLLGIHRR